jgi:hypothetical protein
MKKLKIAFLIISSITIFISCSKTDENSTEQPNLVNKWNIDKKIYDNVNQTLTACEKQGYIQFNSNGTFERKEYYISSGVCEIKKNHSGTYTFNTTTNQITIDFIDPIAGPETEIYKDIQLTTKTLKYTWNQNGSGTGDIYNLEFIK